MATTLRPTTLAMYRTYVDAHIAPNLGGTQLRAVAPDALNRFYADRLASGRRDGKGGLSTRSVRILHVIIHRALRDAVRWGLVARNVADLADPPRTGPRRRRSGPEQVSAFLRSVADDRLAGLWRLAAATGMRRGELLGLRWADVDLETASVAIRQSLAVVNHELTLSEPKTAAGRRSLAVNPETVAALRAHRARQATERLACGPAWQDSDRRAARRCSQGGPGMVRRLCSPARTARRCTRSGSPRPSTATG